MLVFEKVNLLLQRACTVTRADMKQQRHEHRRSHCFNYVLDFLRDQGRTKVLLCQGVTKLHSAPLPPSTESMDLLVRVFKRAYKSVMRVQTVLEFWNKACVNVCLVHAGRCCKHRRDLVCDDTLESR